jgi:CubicO group peptidase (beta-lactamase class C family)
MLRRTSLALAGLVLATACLLGALFVAMSVTESPTYAWRLLRHGESDIEDERIFPSRAIQNPSAFSRVDVAPLSVTLDAEVPAPGGTQREPLEGLLARTGTRAFLIIQDDRLVYERYLGSARDSAHTSFSSAKSVNSALIGAAIADSYIDSVDDPVIRYVPELAGRGLDALTIRDLLLMNTGIRYEYNDDLPFWRVPFADDALTYYAADLREIALRAERGGSPIGEGFRYNNYHPLLEGLILERATGRHVAEYLQERLWKPMGAEFPASWSLDSEASGFEKMESGLNARALDFARFGLLFLHEGHWNGRQILPQAWVSESTRPLRPDRRRWESSADWPARGGYYKYHWWGLNNQDGSYDFFAHGKFDQIVYVAPRKNVVIVRLGDALDPDVRWPLVLQKLLDAIP